ncbi:MAG TPA: hypothetical protein VGR62_03380 [Candidatus Binatia bacterium]|nr:hypothetical protein [Candidatus Binatia bacterium]
MTGLRTAALVCIVLLAVHARAQAPPLRRDLAAYAILAARAVSVERLLLQRGNLGVDCSSARLPNCGNLQASIFILAPDESQIVSDTVLLSKSESVLEQLFVQQLLGTPNVLIGTPGPLPHGTSAFVPPLLGDVDGNGRPSCDVDCRPNADDYRAACRFPAALVPCDPARPLVAIVGQDCSADDRLPGNGRCDPLPGAYGAVTVARAATLALGDGDYAACSLAIEQGGLVAASGTALHLAGGGAVTVGTKAVLGSACGDLRIFMGDDSRLALGTESSLVAHVCGPNSAVDLGTSSEVLGQIVADTVVARGFTAVTGCTAP